MNSKLNLQGYHLTFDDEFNSFTSSPDGSSGTWKTQLYWGGRFNSSNGEQQYYSDSSVGVNPFSVHNGVLDITAAPGPNPAGQPFNSGLITTEKSFAQHEGYFEIRAQLPAGQGLWSAFWMLPTDKTWPPELDVMEFLGGRAPNGDGGDTQYFWHNDANGGDGGWVNTGTSLTSGYHTYGMLWDDYNITVYFDGREIGQAPTPAVYADKSMYMLANLAAGGRWPGPVDPNTLPAHLNIDYIRAYSVDPTTKAVALQPISSPDGANTTPMLAVTNTVGNGSDRLLLRLSEDAYKGDAQFTVSVDGKQIGGVQTVTASHSNGATETLAVLGNWAIGTHTVSVTFLNDLWDGGSNDRNLYLEGAIYNGDTIADGKAGNLASTHQFVLNDTTAVAGTASLDFGLRGSTVSTSGGLPVNVTSQGHSHDVAALHASVLFFVDGQLVFDPADPAAQVVRLYNAALARSPDQAGLNYYIDRIEHGQALADIALGFNTSPEFQSRFGAGLSNDQYVVQLYQNVLHRGAAESELGYYRDRFAQGDTREQTLVNFSESPENKGLTAGTVGSGIWDVSENAAEVARLYDTLLGRKPDMAGLVFYREQLDAGQTTPQGIVQNFTTSPEFQARYGTDLPSAQFVELLYQNTLHRAGSAEEVQYYATQLDAGTLSRAGAVINFSDSPEHIALTAPDIMSENPAQFGIAFA